MAGNWILLLSVICVTRAATYPSDEYLTKPTGLEEELGVVSRAVSFQEALEPELASTLIDHQAINEDLDLVVRTTYPTDSIQSRIIQENTTDTTRTAEVDLTENLATSIEENLETSTVITKDDAENTDVTMLPKETHHSPSTITPARHGTESSKRITNVEGTTINPQEFDRTTPQSVEGPQTTTPTISNENEEVTLMSNVYKSEGDSSTTGDDILTTLGFDMVSYENISTLETDKSPNTTPISGSFEYTPTFGNKNLPSNNSELLTQRVSALHPTTTTSLLNDLTETTEEDAEHTVPNIDDDLSSSHSSESPTVVEPDIFQKTEQPVPDLRRPNETNAVIPGYNNSTTEENIKVEIFSTTGTSTNEPLYSPTSGNDQVKMNHSGTLCNHYTPCSDDQVCILQNEGCFCVSNLNTFSNVQLCEISSEHGVITTSNETVRIVTVENTTSDLDQTGDREFAHTFVTKRWSELSTRLKSRNIVTISFTPAMEVVEWFQSYDWKFRKCVSTTLTTCMRHTMVGLNNSNNVRTFTPSDIVYLAPSPHHDDMYINVSFLVNNPRDVVNNTFLYNTYVVGCLQEGRQHCEAELGLTVNMVDVTFPKRLLGECATSVAGLSARTVKLLFIGAVISLALAVLSLVVFTMKCRQSRGTFDPRSGLYRHPRVLTRSPADGHNLATDEQCQQGEGRRRDPENGDVIGKGDSNTWVVPLDEVEAIERDVKCDKEDDTKV